MKFPSPHPGAQNVALCANIIGYVQNIKHWRDSNENQKTFIGLMFDCISHGNPKWMQYGERRGVKIFPTPVILFLMLLARRHPDKMMK